jgi:hypothetical protein
LNPQTHQLNSHTEGFVSLEVLSSDGFVIVPVVVGVLSSAGFGVVTVGVLISVGLGDVAV